MTSVCGVAKNKWYIAGLHFECQACGNCCSGPDHGYIWVTKPEINFIARFLKIPVPELKKKFLKRYTLKFSIIEADTTNDCIFLQNKPGKKTCKIYPVRPNQCRTWPFWPINLSGPDKWNQATVKCPGINRGKPYSCDEIQMLKKQKNWWIDAKQQCSSHSKSKRNI